MAATGKPATGNEWPAWTQSQGQGLIISDKVEVGVIDYSDCEFWDYVESELAAMAANGALFNTNNSDNGTSGPEVITTSSATKTIAPNAIAVVSVTFAFMTMLLLFTWP